MGQQQFKTHEIKSAKRTLKQLKSILTLRMGKLSELDRNNVAINLIQQQLLKEKSGFVVSNRMQKTIVIKVENRFPHAIYSKTIVKTKRPLKKKKKKKKKKK